MNCSVANTRQWNCICFAYGSAQTTRVFFQRESEREGDRDRERQREILSTHRHHACVRARSIAAVIAIMRKELHFTLTVFKLPKRNYTIANCIRSSSSTNTQNLIHLQFTQHLFAICMQSGLLWSHFHHHCASFALLKLFHSLVIDSLGLHRAQ